MKSILHKAESRGKANHGWLISRHTFSFADYYDPERVNFGALRVLNDDIIEGGKGFDTHPHKNMEIISIPLEGALEHRDSMQNTTVIEKGDIQVMSAGTGIQHSEYNHNKGIQGKFLQIWVFPNQQNVKPRYDQITLQAEDYQNKLFQIVSPDKNDDGVWIHQNAWFHLGKLDEGISSEYHFKDKQNGLYVFVISGSIKVNEQQLDERDGFGMWETDLAKIEAISNAEILLMEVPL